MSKNAYFKKALEIEGDPPSPSAGDRALAVWIACKAIYALLAIARAIETLATTLSEDISRSRR